MKNEKDFDVNQFLSDGVPTEATVTTGNTPSSKQSVPDAPSEPTKPTPSSEQAVMPRRAERPQQTVPAQHIEPTPSALSTQTSVSRVSTRQRRASLDEYREAFMTVPKIIDRQPVFVSRETRDRIDSVVRRLGERKMSVSGFLENLARHHLDWYADDLEQWKRL